MFLLIFFFTDTNSLLLSFFQLDMNGWVLKFYTRWKYYTLTAASDNKKYHQDGGSTALWLLTLLTLTVDTVETVDSVDIVDTVDTVDIVDTVDSVDTVDNAGVKEYFLIECRMQNSRRIF